jgi:hypothetical protein
MKLSLPLTPNKQDDFGYAAGRLWLIANQTCIFFDSDATLQFVISSIVRQQPIHNPVTGFI